MVLLAALSFGAAAGVGATGVQGSYAFAILVSVILCPALLGITGARWLRLGAASTLLGINFLPLVMAVDARFHLGEPVDFWWLLASFAFAWAGWRMGRRPRLKS